MSLASYIAGMPASGGNFTIFKSKNPEIPVGQIVAFGPEPRRPFLAAVYLGEGFYLSYFNGGAVVTNMRSLQKIANTDVHFLMHPHPHDLSEEATSNNVNHWLASATYQKPLSPKEYEARWLWDYRRILERVESPLIRSHLLKRPEALASQKLGFRIQKKPSGWIFLNRPKQYLLSIPRLPEFVDAYNRIIDDPRLGARVDKRTWK